MSSEESPMTMKMVVVMYLEDDEPAVRRLLDDHGVEVFSRMEMEGHGSGARGWYGDVAPYRSGMIFAVLPEAAAADLLDAVRRVGELSDPRHPIHALKLDVADAADSGAGRGP